MPQKALIVRTGPEGHEGLKELNVELEQGWRVVETTPMGGAGGAAEEPCLAALVIIEHRDPEESGPGTMAEPLEEAEEEAEEMVEEVVEGVDDVVEGNGADPSSS